MKTLLGLIVLTLSLQSNAANAAGKYEAGTYAIDPAHTNIGFVINHLVVSEVVGRFNDVKGEIVLGDKITSSKMNATVQATSVDTGVAKRDEDLRSANFLDVAKYPTMVFKSKKITGTPDAFKMTGDLTIKDVTKEVTFDGKYTGAVKDPWGNLRVALQATTKINRQDFHVKYNDMVDLGPAVGNEVTLVLRTEGVKPLPKK